MYSAVLGLGDLLLADFLHQFANQPIFDKVGCARAAVALSLATKRYKVSSCN